MDALELLEPAASELLSRSDGVLARSGAPEGHEILRLLRLTGRLPADLVAEIVTWNPAALDARAEVLREQAERHRDIASELSKPVPWEGPAASAFGVRLNAAAKQSEELADSASSLAVHYTELASWVRVARRQLAQTLASVLSSAEAVTLCTVTMAPLERSAAAIRIGTIVLRDAERFHHACTEFAASWPQPIAAVMPTPLAMPSAIIRAEGLA
jgi:uncharacterized protein YukE